MNTDKNGWVSVNNDLPEFGIEVLWYFANHKYLVAELIEDSDNEHILGGYNADTKMVFSSATHWQYLTTPAK